MRKVNFNKIKVGDLVEDPMVHFALNRPGWSGWQFTLAVVKGKGVDRKTKRNVIAVDMMIPTKRNNYKINEQNFYADCVGYTYLLNHGKRLLERENIKTKDEFYEYIEKENVVGWEDIRFMVEKGFLL